jgi:hypothetical protein
VLNIQIVENNKFDSYSSLLSSGAYNISITNNTFNGSDVKITNPREASSIAFNKFIYTEVSGLNLKISSVYTKQVTTIGDNTFIGTTTSNTAGIDLDSSASPRSSSALIITNNQFSNLATSVSYTYRSLSNHIKSYFKNNTLLNTLYVEDTSYWVSSGNQ